MPSTASPVVTVAEILMLSKGKRPVRINQRPSKIIPRFLLATLLVNVMLFSLWMLADTRNEAAYITRLDGLIWFGKRKSRRYVRRMFAIGFTPQPNEIDELRNAYGAMNDVQRNIKNVRECVRREDFRMADII